MPEVIHCHDWQSALAPVLLRTQYAKDPTVEGLPVVFTIHNMGYQGVFPRDVFEKDRSAQKLYSGSTPQILRPREIFLKGALIFADYLTTVSRKYAQEIQTAEYGQGLDGVVRARADCLTGILNGVDYMAVESRRMNGLIAAEIFGEEFIRQASVQEKPCSKCLDCLRKT